MSTNTDVILATVLSAHRKRLFRSKPVYVAYSKVSSDELENLQSRLGSTLPLTLRQWLVTAGYGDIDDQLSFREEWFSCLNTGELKGSICFAQDILGNFYVYDRPGRIYFLSRSEATYAPMVKDFLEFFEELIRRDYKLIEWTDTLDAQKYSW